MNEQATDCMKIFAKSVSDKDFLKSGLSKELLTLNDEETHSLTRNEQQSLRKIHNGQ